MVANSDSLNGHEGCSRRIYVKGKLYPDLSVPMREIDQSPTKLISGEIETNDPIRVYDCSGLWGDPAFDCDVEKGLPALRDAWIRGRGDVSTYVGREIKPEDDGYLSIRHVESANDRKQNRVFPGLRRDPLRAKNHPVTQLWYARQGIVTPEMEYISIRENLGRERALELLENK